MAAYKVLCRLDRRNFHYHSLAFYQQTETDTFPAIDSISPLEDKPSSFETVGCRTCVPSGTDLHIALTGA